MGHMGVFVAFEQARCALRTSSPHCGGVVTPGQSAMQLSMVSGGSQTSSPHTGTLLGGGGDDNDDEADTLECALCVRS